VYAQFAIAWMRAVSGPGRGLMTESWSPVLESPGNEARSVLELENTGRLVAQSVAQYTVRTRPSGNKTTVIAIGVFAMG
jgi:hypothetical protein